MFPSKKRFVNVCSGNGTKYVGICWFSEKSEFVRFAEERERKREDIKRFIESKARAKSNAGVDEPFVDETFVIAINNHLNSDLTKKPKRI